MPRASINNTKETKDNMKRELLNSKTNSDSILYVATDNTGKKVLKTMMLTNDEEIDDEDVDVEEIDYEEEDEDYSDMHPNETIEEFLEHENYD